LPFLSSFKTDILPGNTLLHGIITFSSNLRQEVIVRISGREALNYSIASNGNNGTRITIRANDEVAQSTQPTTPQVPQVTPAPAQPKPTPDPAVNPNPPHVSPTPVAPKTTPTPAAPKTTPTPIPADNPVQVQPVPTVTPSPEQLSNRGEGDRSGTVSYVAGSDTLIIDTLALESYRIFRLSEPSRVVIDLYQNVIDSKELDVPSGRLYTKIRTGQFDATTARIVLDLKEEHDWQAVKSGSRLTVTLKPSGLKNLSFSNEYQGASLILKGPDLKQKIEQSMAEIRIDDDKDSKTFAFVFINGLIDLGNGKLQVGDRVMKAAQTLTSGKNAFLVIERENAETAYRFRFTDSNDMVVIEPVTSGAQDGSSTGNTDNTGGTGSTGSTGDTGTQPGDVTGSNPTPTPVPVNNGKLIVLDAGHGGTEPGATYGKNEKWYNLDIAKRVEAILLANGVTVKQTRTTDVLVSLNERVNMANDWKADLFVSIHNNAFFDKKMHGSMTFFYTGSYKGKEYATIIHKDLLKNLGSKDLGIKSNTFVVIKKTKMPAVLVEFGCLSNDAERAKLDTEEYRQKAAESLAESILKIIPKLE
ncbi:MAG: AMIN domain-containing protein, partial [Ruminiclostridium sp.]|nr:AMIN domain-containing protein [Ruminiclostridium sp.]